MANQQPQQSYFIPRVAGVPQPPPQQQPQAQLPTEFPPPSEFQTPVEAAFQPQFQPAPPLATPPPFVGRTPFTVPAKSNGGFFRGMARYCWMAVPLAIGASLVLNAAKLPASKEGGLVMAVSLGLIWISGILSGIVALFGIRRHGRKGILIPALAGLFLWAAMGGLAILMIPTFQKIQEMAARKEATAGTESTVPSAYTSTATSTPAPPSGATRKAAPATQSPPVHPEGSTRVEDQELGLSFAILEGYAVPPDASPEENHLYKRKFMTEPTRIIEVRKFDGDFSRHLASAENFPRPPEGQTSESAVFDWRGRKVGGTRSVDAKRNPPYLTFNIVIPLRKQAIVVTVGGAEEYEPVLQEVVDQVLGSLVEETNP